jgi:hypothetical protein
MCLSQMIRKALPGVEVDYRICHHLNSSPFDM